MSLSPIGLSLSLILYRERRTSLSDFVYFGTIHMYLKPLECFYARAFSLCVLRVLYGEYLIPSYVLVENSVSITEDLR